MKKIIRFITLIVIISIIGSVAYAAEGTGPYRRVLSKAGTTSTPYSWMKTSVTLPSSNNVKEVQINDTAYAYIGGVSSTGVQVDAGLQHSPTYGNWAPIIYCNGKSFNTPSSERFDAGQTVTMEFYVVSDNNVRLSATGKVAGVTKTLSVDCNNATGFKKNGVGNQLKRATTIGQKPENLSSGSYVYGVRWFNSYIGTSSSTNHQWLAADMPSSGGYTSYPNSTKVSVSFVNAGEETVTIDLRK